MHQLTDAKVIVQPTPDGYEPPVDHANFLIPWATAAGKKRKRMRDDGDDDSDAAPSDAHDEVKDDDDGGSP